MSGYAIKNFGNGFIGKIASHIDKYSFEGQEGVLDGKEISDFSNVLRKNGIIFDFSKLNETQYMSDLENQFKLSLDKSYTENPQAQKIIEENRDGYNFKKIINQNYDGSITACYEITVNKDVNLSTVLDDLDLKLKSVSDMNEGYDDWGDNGGCTTNKAMQGKTFKVEAKALGEKPDIMDYIGKFIDYLF